MIGCNVRTVNGEHIADIDIPSSQGSITVQSKGASKADALHQAALIAEHIANDPILMAVLPPGVPAAILATKKLASAAKLGGSALKSLWHTLRGPGKKRLAKVLHTEQQQMAVADVGWPFHHKKKKKPTPRQGDHRAGARGGFFASIPKAAAAARARAAMAPPPPDAGPRSSSTYDPAQDPYGGQDPYAQDYGSQYAQPTYGQAAQDPYAQYGYQQPQDPQSDWANQQFAAAQAGQGQYAGPSSDSWEAQQADADGDGGDGY